MYANTTVVDILTEYAKKIEKFKQYKDPRYPEYAFFSEFWEFMDKAYIKPILRGDKEYSEEELKLELGDCIWNLVCLAEDIYELEDIALEIHAGLTDRVSMNKVKMLKNTMDCVIHYEAGANEQGRGIGHILTSYCWDLKEILDMNIAKLEGRLERGTLKGCGDDR